ncbi:MAG TPA: 16S rRNA (cytosine(967)-C(5))-methyltransferase RsmB [Candidatus Lachnoclostridium stercorigallinarum]|uniref:16S rRNA (cytosine(967)-C(5))-methyltransferase n=1 Tax=Candidatus Lachnoclostridium stercorigallinarum TaxID=2838634 RepID=A0A9D2GHN6_9FIRM|nr:16S rRNA (cytosine(967)-C(5))-methyltransferase RsmB [Candidatus Lachnoclostridium stercorigallinarum]
MTTIKETGGREIALDVLTEVLENGAFIHVALSRALFKYQYLEKQERAFITRVVDGTVERLLSIDEAINTCSRVRTEKMKPLIRTLLRMSAYQILYMDRVPDSAACNEAVKLAVKRHFSGLKGFVNGVLRSLSRRKAEFDFEEISLKYSMPRWLVELWEREQGKETAEKMLKAFLEERGTAVRCNCSQASREEILKSLESQGAEAEKSPYGDDILILKDYDYLEGLEAFQKGWIQVQDLSSSFVGRLADPAPGSHIIDVCSAPGGKSLHLAELLKGTGLVEARDLTWQKVSLIEENAERAGCHNVQTEVWDALELKEESVEQADVVIADLPCSGLGIIGKKPDIKYRITEKDLKELAALQREILSVVWRYVKPGGKLIYSTCTVNAMENQENAAWFAGQFPFEPVDIRGKLGPGIQEESMKDGWIQLLPGIHPCDGFFISVFSRKASGEEKSL